MYAFEDQTKTSSIMKGVIRMKSRLYVLFIIALIILGIAGCKNVEKPPSVSSDTPLSPTPSEKSPLSTYQSVLQNKISFYSIDTQKDMNITQLNQAVSEDSSVKVTVTKFAVVDLENDDIPEVILWLSVNNNDFGFEILHYLDGVVYGYTLSYRSFMDLKEDGTFSFSSGAADYGFGMVELTENGYTINKISYSEPSYDSNDIQVVSYYVNHESATRDAFLLAMNTQNDKTGATWYDFTDSNMETLLSDD